MKKFLLYAILILAVFGAADAGYLVIQSVSGKAVVCPNISVGRFNLNQCNVVLATSYAKFLGLPVAFYGLTAYLFLAILVLYELNKRPTVKILTAASTVGVLISAYLVYLQFLVIKALCFYCLVSAAIITLIFILSAAYNMKYSKGV